MAKRKAELTADEILKQMFPDMPDSTDFEQPEEKPTVKADDNAALTALQAQVAQLTSQLAQTRRQAVKQDTDTVPLPPAELDLSKIELPDPIDDPKGYAKALIAATTAHADAKIKYEKDVIMWQNRQVATNQTKADNLLSGFNAKYADYAKNSRQVEVAAAQILSRAKARGEDINDYMYGHSDQFYADVVAEIDDLFGKPKGTASDEDDDDRADALPSGQIGGQDGPSGERKAPPSRYGALGSELRTWQEKTGFYR